jgi:NitT/TauT family transport system ATP-binding protein
MPSIDLRGVTKTFPRPDGRSKLPVFTHFSLHVPNGQVLAVIGPSGIGKTTLLNLLALVEPVDAGEVCFDGRPHTTADVGRVPTGYLFQRDALLPWRTALQNAVLGLECRRAVGPADLQRAKDHFRRYGLEGVEGAWPATLSGGQRQRVALIQNLLPEPDVLLLDEPFGALDFQTKLGLEGELLASLRAVDRRPTTVLVTHDIPQGILLADRLVVVGPPPDGLVLDLLIDLPAAERDPVAGRQSARADELFARVWAELRGLAARTGGKEL